MSLEAKRSAFDDMVIANPDMEKTVGSATHKALANADEVEFAVFCIEGVAERLGVSGAEAFLRLSQSGILNSYIVPFYDVLHTQGRDYIINDIVGFMKEKGVA